MAECNRNLTTEDQGSDDLGYASNCGLAHRDGDLSPKKTSLKLSLEKIESETVERPRRNRWRKLQPKGEKLLMTLTIAGVLIGILIGFSIKATSNKPSETTITLIKFPGELLMRMLKMLIIPIIITSIVTGLANLDMQKSGRMGAHAIIYYLGTTTLAVVLGIILVTAIHPGNSRQRTAFELGEDKKVSTLDTYLDLLRNLFPDNIIAACFELVQTKTTKVMVPVELNNNTEVFNNFTTLNESLAMTNESLVQNSSAAVWKISKKIERVHNPNVLGVIAFFVAFGVTLSSLGEKGKPVSNIFNIFNEIFMKMIMIVIWYSPVGICSLIAGNIVQLDNLKEIGESLGLYMITVITGLLIHGLIVLPFIYFIMTRQNPYKFAAGLIQALLTALGTGSSAGTLPVTMRCLENNLGIDERVTRFVLPIGATMNMDGTALLEGVASITIAQMYDLPLSFGQIITISLTATVASIGAAAIPSAGLVTLLLVLTAIGIPTEAVAILWSIDWFLDRLRTAINVFGDCIGAGIVYHRNKEHLRIVDSQERNPNNECATVKEESSLLLHSSV